MKKVALITGASGGIGIDVAFKLIDEGYSVYGAARRVELMKPLEEKGGKAVYLDLCNVDSIKSCFDSIMAAEGKIDLLVNNAGVGLGGSIEEVPAEEAKKLFDVNVFGLSRLIQLVLPSMRKMNFGKIINISSIAGKLSSPFSGWYHASKYCVEAISDALRMETKGFGIKVVIIEPGMIQTDWGVIHGKSIRKFSCEGTYVKNAEKVAEYYESRYAGSRKLSSPAVISNLVLKAVRKKNPKARYFAGKNSALYLFFARLFPDSLMDFVTSMVLGQKRSPERM